MSEAKKRILVAEADSAARVLLRRRLEAEGYDVSVAEDGEVALRAAGESLPDLLVVDVALPKIDGIQVIRQLRTVGSGGNLPILVVSAQTRDLVDRGLAGVRGPDGFFSKPIDYRELHGRIKALLSPSRSPSFAANGPGGSPGRLTAFIGAKGGVGTTTAALNVAAALVRLDQRTVLLETARFHGTLGALRGVVGSGSVDQLPLEDPGRLTPATLDAALRTHASGLSILTGSSGDRPPPAADGVLALGNGLRAMASQVVVDLDSAVDVYGQVVLRTADRIWVLTQPEPASVERAGALLGLLEAWAVDSRSIGLLVNQTNPEMALEPAEIGQRLGRPVGCWIPYAAGVAIGAGRRALPLVEFARDHPASAALTALATSLVGHQAAVAH